MAGHGRKGGDGKLTWDELYGKYLRLKSENAELRRLLKEREIIEKAKWVLVSSRGLNETEAHKLLINSSRTQRKKVIEVANMIIMTERLIQATGHDTGKGGKP